MKKLNLGCGLDIKKDWINLDSVEEEGVDLVWNLDKFPYPFKDNEFDVILMRGIIEHLTDPKRTIEEIWRISRDKAVIFIDAPHFSNWQAWGDITHKRPFNHTSLFAFSSKPSHRGSSSLLNKRKEIFHIGSKIKIGKIKKLLGIEAVVNLHNVTRGIYERNFCFLLPASNIEFTLRTIKDNTLL
jgi:SAM-dependent methyltransferase